MFISIGVEGLDLPMVEYRKATDYRGQFRESFRRYSDWLLNAMVPWVSEIWVGKNYVLTDEWRVVELVEPGNRSIPHVAVDDW